MGMETAQVWTVIGLLAATLLGLLTVFGGGLNALRNDMQGMNADLRSDMQGMKTDLRGLGGDLRDNTKQLAELTVKVGSLDTEVGSLDTKVGSLDTKVGSLDTSVGLLENKVQGHDRRFDSLEEQISAQGSVLGDAIYGLAEQFREHLRLHAS
jgi:hypothetical protein